MTDLLQWIQTHAEIFWLIVLTVNAVLTAFVILLENREPERSIAWFLALLVFPLVGFIFYLFFGRDWHKRSYQDKRLQHALLAKRKDESPRELANYGADPLERSLRLLATHATGFKPAAGNRVAILTNAQEKYPRLFAALRAAKKTVDVEYFIFRRDKTGLEMIEILKERARTGVRVRLLVDGMGSFGFGAKTFPEMRRAGIECHYFSPLITFFYFLKANYRDHRKIVVVDDETAFTGGINIGDEYLGESKRGPWRDTSVEFRGPCVKHFAELFEDAWTRTTGQPRRTDIKTAAPFADGETVNVIPSGPDADWKAIHQHYLALIHAAQKSVYLQTPYFIPDESLTAALALAALRGVDIKIMLPLNPDYPYLRRVAHTYLDDILRAGARVFEYRTGFLHPKVLIVDETLASVGTCNVDIRSLRLDFEVNALVSSPQTVGRLLSDFERDLKDCDELRYSDFIERPLLSRLKESVARLISPLL